MSRAMILRSTAALTGAMIAASAYAVPIAITNDQPILDEATLTAALTPLDLGGIVTGFGPGQSSLVSPFSDGFISGTITATVYGNIAAPGPGLNEVVLVYTIQSDQGFTGIDDVEFGRNSTLNLDIGDFLNPANTRGLLTADSSAAQTFPNFNYNDNSAMALNDTLFYGFGGADGVGDPLGGASAETFSFYFKTSGSVKIGIVDALIQNGGADTVDTLAFIVDSGQPDLNVPTPGAAALLALGGAFGLRRRRA